MDKYLCWIAHREPYVPYETMVVRSTSSSSSVHRVIDDNSNHYKTLQDLTVLPTEFFRRRKIHIPSVINLPIEMLHR